MPYGVHDFEAINKEFKRKPRESLHTTNILVNKKGGFPSKATEVAL